jgi:hypothetical protein
LLAHSNDPTSFSVLSDTIRTWEPELELELLPAQGRLYDSDGTLYAVCMSDHVTVFTERRRQLVQRGELVVLPQSRAVDLDPDADFLAIHAFGPPPYHFRERFIQVWAFDHLAPNAHSTLAGLVEALSAVESQYRIGLARLDLGTEPVEIPPRGLDASLLVGVDGSTTLEFADSASPIELSPGQLALILPGQGFRASGPASMTVVSLSSEVAHQARLFSARVASVRVSPEYQAGS